MPSKSSNIHDKKRSFPLKIYSINVSKLRKCSHLLMQFLTKMVIFCALICAINRQKTTVKKKITYFIKKFVTSSFTFFEKVFAAGKFFTTRCLDITFCILFVWSSIHSIGIFFFTVGKRVDLEVIFYKGREETFAVSL